jgi:4'-phosphopantetheinyl transferase
MGATTEIMTPPVSADIWKTPFELPELRAGDVHLWRCSLALGEAERGSLVALLDRKERERSDRMRIGEVRQRFDVSHGRLRQILSRYMDAEPADLQFGAAEGGKPHLRSSSEGPGVQFSLSHSGDLALIGVTIDHAIGVDVEIVRDSVDIDLVARRQFAPGEVARLFNVTGTERVSAFYTCWTRKEAYLKARGEGLIGRLQDFEVSFLPGEVPEIRWTKSGAGERTRWSILDAPFGDSASGACVVERPVGDVHYWTYR